MISHTTQASIYLYLSKQLYIWTMTRRCQKLRSLLNTWVASGSVPSIAGWFCTLIGFLWSGCWITRPRHAGIKHRPALCPLQSPGQRLEMICIIACKFATEFCIQHVFKTAYIRVMALWLLLDHIVKWWEDFLHHVIHLRHLHQLILANIN